MTSDVQTINEPNIRDQLIQSGWLNFMQWLAVITMTIDHIAKCIGFGVASPWISDSIGRLAFPFFAAICILHMMHMDNFRSYCFKLLKLAFISQIPYMIIFSQSGYTFNPLDMEWNTILILFIGVMVLGGIHYKMPVYVVLGIMPLVILDISYDGTGLVVMGTAYLIFKQLSGKGGSPLINLSVIVLATMFTSIISGLHVHMISPWVSSLFVLIAFAIMIFTVQLRLYEYPLPVMRMPQTLWHYFYPVHLAILIPIMVWVQ
jgi:hypothetical protein